MSIGRDYRHLFEDVRPTPELDERVISRVHALRAAPAAGGASASPRRSPAPAHLTRRVDLSRSVLPRLALGLAACAAAAALVLGVPALVGPTDGAGGTAANSFGLTIAQADGTEDAVAVEATSDGLLPFENHLGSFFLLKLNLDVTGQNISSVTYRIADSPSIDTPEFMDSDSPTYESVGLLEGIENWVNKDGYTVFGHVSQDSITIDYTQKTGTSDYSVADGTYNFISVDGDPTNSAIWESDPVLSLMREWLDLESASLFDFESGGEMTPEEIFAGIEASNAILDPQREAARQAFVDAFDELASDPDAFYAWLRTLFVRGFELAGGQLEQARLEATVTFSDGSVTTRSYRISLVDGYEQVLAARFDALAELSERRHSDDPFVTDTINKARTQRIPWVDFPVPTDEEAATDPRLSAPIFQIEDVTE